MNHKLLGVNIELLSDHWTLIYAFFCTEQTLKRTNQNQRKKAPNAQSKNQIKKSEEKTRERERKTKNEKKNWELIF